MFRKIRTTLVNNTVHFNLADQLRDQAEKTNQSPGVPSSIVTGVSFGDCLGMISDTLFNPSPTKKRVHDAEMIAKLDGLIDRDTDFMWQQIKAYSNSKNSLIALTVRVCTLLKQSKNSDLVPLLHQKLKEEMELSLLETIDPELLDYIGTTIFSGKFKPDDNFWLALNGDDSEGFWVDALMDLLLTGDESALNFVPKVLEHAAHLNLDVATVDYDSYWNSYHDLLLDCSSARAFQSIAATRKLDHALCIKILDLALTSESGFDLLSQYELTPLIMEFIKALKADGEIADYFVERPDFLVWLKKVAGCVTITPSFAELFLNKIFRSKGADKVVKVFLEHQVFSETISNQLHRVRFDRLSTDLFNLDASKQIEKGIAQILFSFIGLKGYLIQANQVAPICKRISDLAVQKKLKTDHFQEGWLKFTAAVEAGEIYPLDEILAKSFERMIPKTVKVEILTPFLARLAATESKCDSAIRITARMILYCDKSADFHVSSHLKHKFSQIDPAKEYQQPQELIKAILTICSHLQTKAKTQGAEAENEVKELFTTLLNLLSAQTSKVSDALNDDFWAGCFVLGKKLGAWSDESWRKRLPEIDNRLCIEGLNGAKLFLKNQSPDSETVCELLLKQLSGIGARSAVQQQAIFDFVIEQMEIQIQKSDLIHLKALVELFCNDEIVADVSQSQFQTNFKVNLIGLIEALAEFGTVEAFEIATKLPEKYRFDDETLWIGLFTLLKKRYQPKGALTEQEGRNIQCVLTRWNRYLETNQYHHLNKRFVTLHPLIFSLRLMACSNPMVASMEELAVLRDSLEVDMDQNRPTQLLIHLSRYLSLISKYESKLPHEEVAILYKYYSYAMKQQEIIRKPPKEVSLVNLQIQLLCLAMQKEFRSSYAKALWIDVLSNASYSEIEAKLDLLNSSVALTALDGTYLFLNDILEDIIPTVKSDCFNGNRLIKFLLTYLQQNNTGSSENFHKLLTAFINSTNRSKRALDSILVNQLMIKVCEEIDNPDDLNDVVVNLNMATTLLESHIAKRHLAPESHSQVIELFCYNLFNYLQESLGERQKELNAIEAVVRSYLKNRSDLVNVSEVELYKRKTFVSSYLSCSRKLESISLGEVIKVGLNSYGAFLELLNLEAKTTRFLIPQLMKEVGKIVDWQSLYAETIRLPFQSQPKLRGQFNYHFIKLLMTRPWYESAVTVPIFMYFWELIKGFAEDYPKMTKEIEDLYLNFFFLPQNLDLLDEELLFVHCFAWYRTKSMKKVSIENSVIMEVFLRSDVNIELLADRPHLKEQIYSFFLSKVMNHPTVATIKITHALQLQLSNMEEGEWDVVLLNAFYELVRRFDQDVISTMNLFQTFEVGLELATMILESPLYSKHQKTMMASTLASFYHESIKRNSDESKGAEWGARRDFYLNLPLLKGWVDTENVTYAKRCKEILK